MKNYKDSYKQDSLASSNSKKQIAPTNSNTNTKAKTPLTNLIYKNLNLNMEASKQKLTPTNPSANNQGGNNTTSNTNNNNNINNNNNTNTPNQTINLNNLQSQPSQLAYQPSTYQQPTPSSENSMISKLMKRGSTGGGGSSLIGQGVFSHQHSNSSTINPMNSNSNIPFSMPQSIFNSPQQSPQSNTAKISLQQQNNVLQESFGTLMDRCSTGLIQQVPLYNTPVHSQHNSNNTMMTTLQKNQKLNSELQPQTVPVKSQYDKTDKRQQYQGIHEKSSSIHQKSPNVNNIQLHLQQQQLLQQQQMILQQQQQQQQIQDKSKPISFLNYLLLKEMAVQTQIEESEAPNSSFTNSMQSSHFNLTGNNFHVPSTSQSKNSSTNHSRNNSIKSNNTNNQSTTNSSNLHSRNNSGHHNALQLTPNSSSKHNTINLNSATQNQTINIDIAKDFMSRNNFAYQYVIGKGGFGKVWKVENKKTKQLFAMKEMKKSLIMSKKSVASVMNQRNLLSILQHPFLVNMFYAFQDQENLYLVMDLMPGGDLRYHIGRPDRFNEEQTRFFVACIFLGLEYLHNNNIIHRDIKPQNLVLDSKGYVRITDLGIARVWKPDNSNDTSGTPGYMAPQVMCRNPHSYAADYFALGVLCYEFMLGRRPYNGRNRKQIKDQITAQRVQIQNSQIPDGWSLQAADFINKLIERQPSSRLGFNGPSQVKNHPWIRNFPWQKLLNKQLYAPFLPGQADNFDEKQQITVEDEQFKQLIQENTLLLRRPSVQSLFEGYYFDNHINNMTTNLSTEQSINNSNFNKTNNTISTNSSTRKIFNRENSIGVSQRNSNIFFH